MKKEFRIQAFQELTLLRNKNITLLQKATAEQAQIIPDKVSNNLYWQAGHILTTQMSLLYRRSNLKIPLIDTSYITYFAKGTSPENFDTNIPSYQTLLKQLSESLSILENDLHIHADKQYSEPAHVSFGMTLESFHDAVLAIGYHEAYHMNAINLLLKQINN